MNVSIKNFPYKNLFEHNFTTTNNVITSYVEI